MFALAIVFCIVTAIAIIFALAEGIVNYIASR
jgi:hypothetical protein